MPSHTANNDNPRICPCAFLCFPNCTLPAEKGLTGFIGPSKSVPKQPFSILLLDGDELTRYNNISYAAGDEMIHKISVILSERLRPGDFVARWRAGDEFISILPNTTSPGAMVVGTRFCAAIREASQAWRFPTSITIGVATFPKHGQTVDELVDKAEGALKKGKDMGKNRVVLAE